MKKMPGQTQRRIGAGYAHDARNARGRARDASGRALPVVWSHMGHVAAWDAVQSGALPAAKLRYGVVRHYLTSPIVWYSFPRKAITATH